jgi:hypothetical protein
MTDERRLKNKFNQLTLTKPQNKVGFKLEKAAQGAAIYPARGREGGSRR